MTAAPYDILIVDPGMAQSFGHHYAYNRALRDWCAASGGQSRFLFSRQVPAELLAEFPGGRGVFSWSPYLQRSLFGEGPKETLRRTAEDFAAELRAHIEADADTLVFAHTLDPASLYGFAFWQANLPENRRPRLALTVMLGVVDNVTGRESLAPACAILKQTKRARLFGGSKAAARLLSELFGHACAMLPTPLPKGLERFRTEGAGGLLFGTAGDARRGKNLHILAPAILRYLAGGGAGRFHIHLTPTDEALIPALLPLHDLSREYPERVILEWKYLGEEEYLTRLGGFTALIIPYRAEEYHACRPSGLVVEATALGVPLVACAGGFAEDEIASLDNGSLFMVQADPKELARALALFEREKDARKAGALAVAPAYAAGHGLDALMRLALG